MGSHTKAPSLPLVDLHSRKTNNADCDAILITRYRSSSSGARSVVWLCLMEWRLVSDVHV
jgi:hypothetical protein